MAPQQRKRDNSYLRAPFVLGLSLTLSACGESGGGPDGAGTGGGSQSGGTSSGGQGGSGGQTMSGGQPAAGGQSPTGGQPAAGGQATTGGQPAAGGGAAPTGGASSGGASGGAAPSGGAESGGNQSGGGGSTMSGGTTGSGGTSGGECTRALLDGLVDHYFEALTEGDPSGLPLAANLKFTENAQQSEIGTTEFWMNAGDVKYSQRALDTEQCSVAAQAVVPENGMDLPIALRIKVEAGEMTEIETIVVRPGDYTAVFAVDSNPAAIIDIAGDIGWHDEVPAAERATREELSAWIDDYFRYFPGGVCDVTPSCTRLENGGGDFSCGGQASCNTGGQGSVLVPRLIIVDEIRGIAAGLTMFDFQTTGHLDMHMMKMSGGQVHAVQAILRDTNGVSGWD